MSGRIHGIAAMGEEHQIRPAQPGKPVPGTFGPIDEPFKLATPIRYALRHWDGIVQFTHDGRIETDTNTPLFFGNLRQILAVSGKKEDRLTEIAKEERSF